MIVNKKNILKLKQACHKYEIQVKYCGMYEDLKEYRKDLNCSISELLELYINEYIPSMIEGNSEEGYSKEELTPFYDLLKDFKMLHYGIEVIRE